MYLIRLSLLSLILLTSVSCATLGADLQSLNKFTATDIQAALDDATAHGDQEAVACYATLLKVLPQIQQAQPGKPVGLVSAFQSTREVVSAGTVGINTLAKQINLGCAALFVDANATIAKLVMMGLPIVK